MYEKICLNHTSEIMRREDYKKKMSETVKSRDNILEKGKEIVNDMKLLDEFESLDSLDEETKELIRKEIGEASKEVKETFENDVENELTEIEKEFETLQNEAKDKKDAAVQMSRSIENTSFEYMKPNILSDAAKEAKDSEEIWQDNIEDITEAKDTTQDRLKDLKSKLGGN